MTNCVICAKEAEYIFEVKTMFTTAILRKPIEIEFRGDYCNKHLVQRCKTIISILTKKRKRKKKQLRKKSKKTQKRKKHRRRK